MNFVKAICAGDSITLTSPSPTEYEWSTGAISPSIMVKTAGNYSVTVSNSSNCILRLETTDVTLNSLPQASITANTKVLCEGSDAVIASNEAASYLWNTGAVSQSISVSHAGSYHVTITDSNGCQCYIRECITKIHSALARGKHFFRIAIEYLLTRICL